MPDTPQQQYWKELGKFQEEFTFKFALLVLWATTAGIPVRLRDAYRDERLHGKWGEKRGYGAACSVHKVGLAVDLVLPHPEDYVRLHDQWDKYGGAPRIEDDMGHFSMRWRGYH